MRRVARDAFLFLVAALVVAWVVPGHQTGPVAPPQATTSTAPGYTGPAAACDVGGYRVVTDPTDAARLHPCYSYSEERTP